MAQLHKKFTDDQVKELIERYLKGEIERTYIQDILTIKKKRFLAKKLGPLWRNGLQSGRKQECKKTNCEDNFREHFQ
jgi:uncharacterized protein (DUF2164 family)